MNLNDLIEPKLMSEMLAAGYVRHQDHPSLPLLTGMSAVTIWELLSTGKTLDDVLGCVPDEFYKWVKDTAEKLAVDFQNISEEAKRQYACALAESGVTGEMTREARKTFALAAVRHYHKSALFSLLDGKPIDEYVWKQIRPTRSVPFRCGE